MFDIGFGELVLLFFLFLVLFGPEKLPEIARGIGKFYSEIKGYFTDIKDNVERELKVEELRKINKIPDNVKDLVLSPEEVEKRKRELLEKREKNKKEE